MNAELWGLRFMNIKVALPEKINRSLDGCEFLIDS